MESRKGGFFLNRRVLSKFPATPCQPLGKETILLDKNIAHEELDEVPDLLCKRNGNVFLYKSRIRPQAFELICSLHTVRDKNENAFTLQTLADRLSVANKRTVSTRIREVNDICNQMDAKAVFRKLPGDKWGLNIEMSQGES